MTTRKLILRSLTHYWRSNLAVAAGVATAVAVLAGSLVVGRSVRSSLRQLALERLGNTHSAVISKHPFREELAGEFPDAAPLIALEGIVSHQASGRRATRVAVYAVDERFWHFHQRAALHLSPSETAISEALAYDLGAARDHAVILRVEKPSSIPAESLFGRKEDAAITVRFRVKTVLGPAQLGEFSLRPHQGAVRAIFVPLKRLQSEMGLPDRVNTLLLGSSAPNPEKTLRERFDLQDLGVRVRWIGSSGALDVSTSSGLLPERLAGTVESLARESSFETLPVLTYLANTIRVRDRETPYSLVAAVDLRALPLPRSIELPSDAIVLNEWTARDLGARPGDTVELEYYLWEPDGRLVTRSTTFQLAAITPIRGLAADRDLVPEYPGITDSASVSDWDPPFPLDLRRIRPKDEDYWDNYRTTPKAFVWLDSGQPLWQSRFGRLTGIRLLPPPSAPAGDLTVDYERRLRAALDPLENGLALVPFRTQNLEAAQGATDFSEYFLYFSFFLLVSAVLLAGLFFRLGIEQRLTQIGLLEAIGIPWPRIAWIFRIEGLALVATGSLLGALGSLAWSALVLYALRTWWVDAVGTRRLDLAPTPGALLIGALAGMLISFLAVGLTLRDLRQATPRGLLAGAGPASMRLEPGRRSRAPMLLLAATAGALALLGASAAALIPDAAGFFAAAALLLIASLAALRTGLDRSFNTSLEGGPGAGWRFAFRNASARPGRTLLSAALIAFATFLIVSVQSFRRDGNASTRDPRSGAGGYPLIAESVRPLYYNLNDEAGRRNLNLDSLPDVKFVAFRLRPGDDASCLNLFQPQNPRVLGAPDPFIQAARFSFAASLADSPEERNNPWLMLYRRFEDGALPAIADANSLAYVLHKKLGEEIEIPSDGGSPVRLRIVAALSDSIFQSELIVAESRFVQAFPQQSGWRVFLIEAPEQELAELPELLEESLRDYGFDITTTASRLATFHRVENTYLSTFQSLGALGLLLGTAGLGAVLFRNVLERRRELALLEAIGWPQRSVRGLVLRENLVLLLGGLTAGALCALLAIAPVIARRGFTSDALSLVWLLIAIAGAGFLACWAAARTAMRLPLMSSLRSE
jgi:putative ABC transport system permease protein